MRDRLHAQVVASFEQRILSGALKVGEKMPAEAEIAKTFAISTRSVREALQILEVKGLVKRRHGGRAEVVRDDVGQYLASLGTTVRSLFHRDPFHLVEVMKVRRMFEVDAARQLAAGTGDLEGVALALGRMGASVEACDFEAYAQADAAFHRALVRALGNEVMSMLYDAIYQLVVDVILVSVRVPSKPMENGLVEHRGLHDAILTGSPARAAKRSASTSPTPPATSCSRCRAAPTGRPGHDRARRRHSPLPMGLRRPGRRFRQDRAGGLHKPGITVCGGRAARASTSSPESGCDRSRRLQRTKPKVPDDVEAGQNEGGNHATEILAAGAIVAVLCGTTAALAEYPERPITLIVPWSAGGGTDATGRIIAAMLEEKLGEPANVVAAASSAIRRSRTARPTATRSASSPPSCRCTNPSAPPTSRMTTTR